MGHKKGVLVEYNPGGAGEETLQGADAKKRSQLYFQGDPSRTLGGRGSRDLES